MKIAIDLTSLKNGLSGIERYASSMSIALVLQDTKNEYELFFKDEVDTRVRTALSVCPKVKYSIIGSKGHAGYYFSEVIAPKHFNNSDADLFLFFAFPAPLMLKKGYIGTIHDLTFHDCPKTMTRINRLYWRFWDYITTRRAYRIVTISNFSASRIREYYKKLKQPIVIAYCGIDSEKFSSNESSPKSDVLKKYSLPNSFVLSLSTLEPRKNIPLLVEAWSELFEDDRISLSLVLAGKKGWLFDDVLEGLGEKSKQHVRFTGFVEDDDLPYLYRASTVFVFPSIYEGFGLPPVEAYYSGAKVLCSDIPCLKEICGNSIQYFDVTSKEDLKKKLIDIVSAKRSSSNSLPREYEWATEAQKILYEIDSIASISELKWTKTKSN